MLTVNKIIDNSIFYTCGCGVEGKCIYKSFSSTTPSILTIRCPSCATSLLVTIGNESQTNQEEDINYSLSIIVSNEVL